VPALAEALPCQFEFLTTADDEPHIRQHPWFEKLSKVCQTRVRTIDHLITARNYSTTITLAYAESVRAAGSAMLDTAFIFLVSDYLMADGSLRSVLARLRSGSNAVLAGNFQVVAEQSIQSLRALIAPGEPDLALSSREWMRWALARLHPSTSANIVNNPLGHNSHTNRLFWRIDANTLLGRFYLMHMIAIRPEVKDF